MKKKIVIFLVQLIFIVFHLSSFSRKAETIFIVNYSSNRITIDYEFVNGNSDEKQNYIFEQFINGINLAIRDELFNKNGFLINSMKTRYILSYYPAVSILESTDCYEQMASIPFMDKMKAIYKSFIVKDEKGTELISLDTLNNYVIKKKTMGIVSYYYIEIFDYDYEGKPASQW